MTTPRANWYVVWSDGTSAVVKTARGYRHAILQASRANGNRRDAVEVRKFRPGHPFIIVRSWRLS
jgi:hypothetical protein